MNTTIMEKYWIGIDWANNLNDEVDELNEQIKGLFLKLFERYYKINLKDIIK